MYLSQQHWNERKVLKIWPEVSEKHIPIKVIAILKFIATSWISLNHMEIFNSAKHKSKQKQNNLAYQIIFPFFSFGNSGKYIPFHFIT